MLAQTPLHAWHASHGGRMVDFAGWSMPVQYASIVAEHQATRQAVGLFDVSHMGRFSFAGPDAQRWLDSLLTRRVDTLRSGQIRYSLVTNDAGGILDDVLIYRLGGEPAAEGPAGEGANRDYFMLVVNASNREKIWNWLASHSSPNVQMADVTLDTAMIAVQGPRALELVQPVVDTDLAALRYYHGRAAIVNRMQGLVSRTGYTGEDGCELIVPAIAALPLWEKLAAKAAEFGGMAAGLGARDTLRLEAGMPLYGHELSETIDPFQADLAFAVDLSNRDFPGHNALSQLKDDPTLPRRVGLMLAGKRVPREGYAIHDDFQVVGHVTSGTFSPTLDRPIAMGYVRPDLAVPGQQLFIALRSHREPAQVVPLPFYRRTA